MVAESGWDRQKGAQNVGSQILAEQGHSQMRAEPGVGCGIERSSCLFVLMVEPGGDKC